MDWIIVALISILAIALIAYAYFKLFNYLINKGLKKDLVFPITEAIFVILIALFLAIILPIKFGWKLLILIIAGLYGAIVGYGNWIAIRDADEDYKKEQDLINKNTTGFKKVIKDIAITLLIIITILISIFTIYFRIKFGH